MGKIVQTELSDAEYSLLVNYLQRKKITIKELLREALMSYLTKKRDINLKTRSLMSP